MSDAMPSVVTTAARPALKDRPMKTARVKAAGGATLGQEASREARRLAAAILEVLAGARTPASAAAALAMSLPGYYQWESRALRLFVTACEPKPRGRTRSVERELAALKRQQTRLERELARQQALARLAQRAIGLPAATTPASPAGDKKRRRRRPAVRALSAAVQLQRDGNDPAAAPATQEVTR
jgi:hypothetical protein